MEGAWIRRVTLSSMDISSKLYGRIEILVVWSELIRPSGCRRGGASNACICDAAVSLSRREW